MIRCNDLLKWLRYKGVVFVVFCRFLLHSVPKIDCFALFFRINAIILHRENEKLI